MKLDLMRESAREFPQVEDPVTITSARVWHCKYRTLAPLSHLVNLRTLEIATFPDDSLQLLTPLQALEALEITHLTGRVGSGASCRLEELAEVAPSHNAGLGLIRQGDHGRVTGPDL